MGQPFYRDEADGNGIVRTYSVLEGIICAPNGVEAWRTNSSGAITGSHGVGANALANGSAVSPSVAFVNDASSDSGLYLIGANNIGASAGGDLVWDWNTTRIQLASGINIVWGAGTVLAEDAANILAQRNSTTAQAFRVYNTFTSSSVGEYVGVDWKTEANVATVGTRTFATGTSRPLNLVSQAANAGVYAALKIDQNTAPFLTFGSQTTLGTFDNGNTTGLTWIRLAKFTSTATSGSVVPVEIAPIYNQASGTAANTDLLINRTQTAIGSGAQNFIDLQVASVSKFLVNNLGDVVVPTGDIRVGGTTGTRFNINSVGTLGAKYLVLGSDAATNRDVAFSRLAANQLGLTDGDLTSNTADLGSATTVVRNGWFGTALHTPVLVLGGTAANAATTVTAKIKKVSAIADNTATTILTVTIPNANHAAAVSLRFITSNGSTDAFETTRVAQGTIVISRITGADTVASASVIDHEGIASSGVNTHTLAYSITAMTGAASATQTFNIQVTINDNGNTGGNQCVVYYELLNAEATGVTIA